MKRVITTLGLAAVAALVWIAPTAAFATEPVDFAGQYIIDDTDAGVLGNKAGDLEKQVRAFANEHGIQLFVVYVDNFSNPADPEAWGAATAQNNFLGDDAVLLSVAVEDRLFDLNAPQALISNAEYDKLTSNFVRPALKNSDWAGVVGATLDGLDKTVISTPSGNSGVTLAVVGGAVVVGGGIAAGVTISRKRKRAAVQQQGVQSLKELEEQATSLLVDVDDDLRSSNQELGFAEAQFGRDAAAPYAAAIAEARSQLDAAFLLRQKLDDNIPDTDEERRAWLSEIVDRCSGASESLNSHADSFTQLREIEQRIPDVIEQLSASLPGVQTQLGPARSAAANLAASYAPSVVAQLSTNLDEAARRLEFVAECITSGTQENAAGEKSAAAVTLRAGEAALEQARTLVASPEVLAAELAESTAQFEAAAADLRGDIQSATGLLDSVSNEQRQGLQQAIHQVEAALATQALGDPVSALNAAAAANVQIDTAIGSAREQSERTRRAVSARDEALISARSEVFSAEQFIETRRGAIGAQARTRLAEAKRQLELAEHQAQTDPAASFQSAQRASQYARAAHQAAANDVSGWGGGSGGGANNSFGGAVLGGILGSLLSGGGSSGGRSSGGWSGSSGGFTGGWGGGGGGSLGSGGGRRGGGGRF